MLTSDNGALVKTLNGSHQSFMWALLVIAGLHMVAATLTPAEITGIYSITTAHVSVSRPCPLPILKPGDQLTKPVRRSVFLAMIRCGM
jgi:hypothetical protein